MNRILDETEIRYLLDHLKMVSPGLDLYNIIHTCRSDESIEKENEPHMIFPLSELPPDVENPVQIDSVPVLFPLSEKKSWYTMEGDALVFHHDILKSAFYLLSGYQEYDNSGMDHLGRYPWRSSIQYRMGITQKPLVNYYFEIILEAAEKFCLFHGLPFLKKDPRKPVLFLSHDIDRIRKYSLRNMVYMMMVLAGLKPGTKPLSGKWQDFVDVLLGILLFKKDPYWNFQELMTLEAALEIRSTWFFLEKTREDNSKYHFHSEKIRKLIAALKEKGHEIGIHGTLESSEDPEAMSRSIDRLKAASGSEIKGIRQHYLKYSFPTTTRIQAGSGLQYDATLGFAEQIGFRNSYTLPFRLYDFEKKKACDIWQLPLTTMDVSLIQYMGTPVGDVNLVLEPLIFEVQKFGGIFGLLWHNCRLDEEESPGIMKAYEMCLERFLELGFASKTGTELISDLRSFGS